MLSQIEVNVDEHSKAFVSGLTNGQVQDLIRSSCKWFGIASWRYFRYCGLDVEVLEDVLTVTAEVVRLPDDFWTQSDHYPA